MNKLASDSLSLIMKPFSHLSGSYKLQLLTKIKKVSQILKMQKK